MISDFDLISIDQRGVNSSADPFENEKRWGTFGPCPFNQSGVVICWLTSDLFFFLFPFLQNSQSWTFGARHHLSSRRVVGMILWRYFGRSKFYFQRDRLSQFMWLLLIHWHPRQSSPFQPCTAMRSSISICQHQKSWCRCWGLQTTFLPMKLLEPTFDLSGTQETYPSQIPGNGDYSGLRLKSLIVVLIVSFLLIPQIAFAMGCCYFSYKKYLVPWLDPWC